MYMTIISNARQQSLAVLSWALSEKRPLRTIYGDIEKRVMGKEIRKQYFLEKAKSGHKRTRSEIGHGITDILLVSDSAYVFALITLLL